MTAASMDEKEPLDAINDNSGEPIEPQLKDKDAPKSDLDDDANKKDVASSTASDAISKEDLWKDSTEKTVEGATVEMMGLEKKGNTVYIRVSKGDLSIGKLVEVVVDEVRLSVIQNLILHEHRRIKGSDEYPPAAQLIELGAVWLLNETEWAQHHSMHSHRCSAQDWDRTPNWQDMTLRVHYLPDRYHAASSVDWTKYKRGLLVGNKVHVQIGGETPHVPVADLPNAIDGVIVYEDPIMGFAVIDKPWNMPVHPTLSNHKEDVVSLYRHAWQDRRPNKHQEKLYVSVPKRIMASLDIDTGGLLTICTRPEFATYWNWLLDHKKVQKKYKCLVCVKDDAGMDQLEKLQQSHNPVRHYVDNKSHRTVKNKPNSQPEHFKECKMRILQVGDERFRAACVRSVYPDSADNSLAHRLWGPHVTADDLGVSYVMELEVELLSNHEHQIRGQMAALGFPVVGDCEYGGGTCDFHSHGHTWNRMALQCSEMSFPEPHWKDDKKEKLEASKQKICSFSLHQDAWWSELLEQYELYHQAITMETKGGGDE